MHPNTYLIVNSDEIRMKKLKTTLYNAGCHFSETLGKSYRAWFVTLTYKNLGDWSANHIKEYLKRVRSFLHRRDIPLRYVWVAELQKRGAVHYHLVFWLPVSYKGKRFRMPRADDQGWWTHGSTNTQISKKGVGYLMKYVSKVTSSESDGKFPKGCRIFGVGGLDKPGKMRVRWFKAPSYVRNHFSHLQADLRKVKGGYVDRLTDQFVESIWMLALRVGRRLLFVLRSATSDFLSSDCFLSVVESLSYDHRKQELTA